MLRDGHDSFTLSSCCSDFGWFDFHIWCLSADDVSSAVWMALESQSDSVRADDLVNLCDPWRLPLDCFSQSSSPSKSDLVHGCLEHRARGNHDRSSSNHAV